MTTPPETDPSAAQQTAPQETPLRSEAIVELVGLALLVLGGVAVVVAAFAWDWRAGVAVLGAAACAAGTRMTFREE